MLYTEYPPDPHIYRRDRWAGGHRCQVKSKEQRLKEKPNPTLALQTDGVTIIVEV